MENHEHETELLTAGEVLLKHGLNWGVIKKRIYDDQGNELTAFKAVTRADNGHVFQISRNRYEPISNGVACGILDEVVGTGLAKYTGASSFKDGALIMVTAEVPELEYRIQDDTIKNYLHVATSHDGTMSTFIFGSQQRYRCRNLLTSVLKQDVSTLKFRHTAGYRLKIEEFQAIFKDYREAFNFQQQTFQALAKKDMTRLELDSFLNKLLNLDEKQAEEVSTRSKNVKLELARLYDDGIGHSEMADTRWRAYQAVTQYVTHERSTRGDVSNRNYANYFGSGATLRDRALELLAA